MTNVDLAIIDAYSAWGDLMLPQKLAKLRKRLKDDIEKERLDTSDSSHDMLSGATSTEHGNSAEEPRNDGLMNGIGFEDDGNKT